MSFPFSIQTGDVDLAFSLNRADHLRHPPVFGGIEINTCTWSGCRCLARSDFPSAPTCGNFPKMLSVLPEQRRSHSFVPDSPSMSQLGRSCDWMTIMLR
jgi:hypothetical protein